MPYDTMTMAAVADELRTAITGGYVQKIVQPSALSVGLSVYRTGNKHWLLLSAEPQLARIHLVGDRLAKAFPEPSAFVMLLRKYLEGGQIVEIEQQRGERIVYLHCTSGEATTCLLAEVMGKHSNVILLDDTNTVLGAAKIIPPRLSRARPILPGKAYKPPPAQPRDLKLFPRGPRLDPYTSPHECIHLLGEADPATAVWSALLGLLSGASPFLVTQIVLSAGLEQAVLLADTDIPSLVEAAGARYQLYVTRDWQPCTFSDPSKKPQYAAFTPMGMSAIYTLTSMSQAIERAVGTQESRDTLAASRHTLLADVNRRRALIGAKLSSLQRGLEASGQAETIMERGQLVLTYAHAVTPGSVELTVPELGVCIPLDPRLSPAENAEKLFRRYKKLRDARRRLPALIANTQTEATRLDELATFIGLAQSERDLHDLRQEFQPPDNLKPSRKPQKETRRGPARYVWQKTGDVAIVGRHARENEEVTFRVARRDDLWLHAKGRTGAHVVLQRRSVEPGEGVTAAAAQLAAYFSEGRRDSKVDVDVTDVRQVRKLSGGIPGKVTYQNFRTLQVQPDISGWIKR
jgi:predicted ribosome quality control (RQC) complex YloA/Tae2 family protein